MIRKVLPKEAIFESKNYENECQYKKVAKKAAKKGRSIFAIKKKIFEKEKPKKKLFTYRHKWNKDDYEKIIRFYCSGEYVSFKDVSRLTGIPLPTVTKVIQKFRKG